MVKPISWIVGRKGLAWKLIQISLIFVCFQASAKNIQKIYQFNIPPQSLIESLGVLSEITEQISLFPYYLVKEKKSGDLIGSYTAQQALDLLLKDTGLQGTVLNNDTFLLKPVLSSPEINKQIELTAGLGELKKREEVLEQVDSVEVIEVHGSLRQSLEGSVSIKRTANTIIDVITTEDIGQFSDDSIAGAIQRTPGVQVENDDSGTQGDRVSIRGLGPEFVNSTINGRRLLSAGTEATSLRQTNFNIFPSNILGGVIITKGQVTSKPESGLAGQVDLQTLKPLKINSLNNETSFFKASLERRYQDLSNDGGYRFSGIAALHDKDKTLGAYITFVYADENNARDQLRVNSEETAVDLDTTGDRLPDSSITAFAPRAITLNPIRERPVRTAVSTGIEYKPNEDLNIYLDLIYSKYDNKSQRQSRQIILANTYNGMIFNNTDSDDLAFITDDNNVVKYINFGKATGDANISDILKSFQYNNKTENLVTGLNIDYFINDNLKSNFDIYYSGVKYNQDLRTTNVIKSLSNDGFIYDSLSNIVTFSTSDSDLLDGYNYSQSTLRPIALKGDDYGFSADFNYRVDNSWFVNSLIYGTRYNTTNTSVKITDFYQLSPESVDQAAALTLATLPGTLIDQKFFGSTSNYHPSLWFYSDYDAAIAIDPRIVNTSLEDIGASKALSYDITENIFSLYGQVNLEIDIFELNLTGNLGIKAVYTSQDSQAYQVVDGVEMPITTYSDYWEYLPSLNLRLEIHEDLILRFGLSRSLTRPEYALMAPTNIITTPTSDGEVGTATLGNSALLPMTSINSDITLEWYPESEGALSFSLFNKEISDFILEQTVSDTELSGYAGLFETTTHTNYSDGDVSGFELSYYQPFDEIIPELAGFGISVNYTYVDSAFNKDIGDEGFGFPGSSKDNFNFITFYEEYDYSVRLAYVYRAEFFRQLAGSGVQVDSAIFTEAQGKLDLSMIFRPTENLSLRFNVSNITGENRRDFVADKSTFLEYYDRGRTYSITATYDF